MTTLVERYANPVLDTTVRLRLFAYNANQYANLNSITQVQIYQLNQFPTVTESFRTLVQTIPGSSVIQDSTGQYEVQVSLIDSLYQVGYYEDVWTVTYPTQPLNPALITNHFQVYPNLWYTTPIPVVYDFQFSFTPNRIVQGSVRPLVCEVQPNVPLGSDLCKYYENLAILGGMTISIQQVCGDCLPTEADLRMVVDNAPMTFQEKHFGYYTLDTTNLECGIYDVWFTLNFGGNVYISDRSQLQIFI